MSTSNFLSDPASNSKVEREVACMGEQGTPKEPSLGGGAAAAVSGWSGLLGWVPVHRMLQHSAVFGEILSFWETGKL